MKKLLFFTFVLTLAFLLATPVIAAPTGYISGDVTEISKEAYDSFDFTKESANNTTVPGVGGVNGIDFVCDNEQGWYLDVTDGSLAGSIEVAYKISDLYYIVSFAINGSGKYYVGDGRGANGVNHAKVGAFVPNEEEETWTFIGYEYVYAGAGLYKNSQGENNVLRGELTVVAVYESNKGNIEKDVIDTIEYKYTFGPGNFRYAEAPIDMAWNFIDRNGVERDGSKSFTVCVTVDNRGHSEFDSYGERLTAVSIAYK